MLQSRLFKDDPRLQRCLVNDPNHVVQGEKGPHVRAIQVALVVIDDLSISDEELSQQFYGATTAQAVLAYKRKRAIINKSYQSAPDDIVGKMTIAALDKDALAEESSTSVARRKFPCQQVGFGRSPGNDVEPPPSGILLAQAQRQSASGRA